MLFCTKCGSQLNEGAVFCTKCGNAATEISEKQTTQPKQMYEEFIPTFGLGKRFVFTETTLIFGNEEYSYSQLSSIELLSTAEAPLSNGVASTVTESGITLTLGYNHKDNVRFAIAMSYANEQIDLIHGNTKNYKYLFQAHSGSKIEVYNDYLILYYVPLGSSKGSESVNTISNSFGMSGKGISGKLAGGLGNVFDGIASVGTGLKNTMKGGATGNIIMFEDLTVQINTDSLIINEYSLPLNSQNFERAKEIVDYIEESKKLEKSDTQAQSELWESIIGVAKTFSLFGEVVDVAEKLDVFNSYRLTFREMAFKNADKAISEYKSRIRDFITFIEFYPKIYIENLEPLIRRAIDILVSEEVWTVTYDSFLEQHLADFHFAFDAYETTLESVALTSEANQERTAGFMSLVPNLVGGGFGLKGAIKGIATATAFNVVRDGIENSAVKNAANIKPVQQIELYQRINCEIVFEQIFADYWNVFLSLVWTLNQNGHDIWWQTDEVDQQAKNVFQNLSNPNFPQDKVLKALIGLLELNPYNPQYYDFAISRFGESDEVAELKEYFGYNCTDPRTC